MRLTKELSDKTAKNTSMPGCEVLRREMDHMQSEWQDYISRIHQAEEDLEHAQLQWGDFETKFDACSQWLKNMEQQVKNYELKSTLPEKKTQVEKFKVRTLVFNPLLHTLFLDHDIIFYFKTTLKNSGKV